MSECLLFVDRLGMKAALRQGTAIGRSHLSGFQQRVARSLASGQLLDAAVESDSGVAIFSDVRAAIECGEGLFKSLFDADGPIWARGVIVDCSGIRRIDDLMSTRHASGIPIRTPSPALLNALVAEKSGFRGMRLRVEGNLLSPGDRSALKRSVITEDPNDAVRPPRNNVYLTRSLRFAGGQASDGFEDVFWMLDDEPDFNARDVELSYRLKRAGVNPEEAQHAAMTKVVFEEVRAIAQIVRR